DLAYHDSARHQRRIRARSARLLDERESGACPGDARASGRVCHLPALGDVGAPALEKRDTETRFAGDAFVRTELFFGSERPGLPEVSPEEFNEFLDIAVTPCFPDGLTLLTGKGQFRESDGQIVQETSFVLVLLYPLEARRDSHAKIEALRALYKEHFQQESVLRVDDSRAVRVGF